MTDMEKLAQAWDCEVSVAAARLKKLTAAGLAIVPVKMTGEMVLAGLVPLRDETIEDPARVRGIYAAMLSAGSLRPSPGQEG